MGILILGLVVFLGAHVFMTCAASARPWSRASASGPTRACIALVSLIGIVLIGYGFARYRAAGMIEIWYPPRWTRHVTQLLLWPAFICVAAAYIPRRHQAACSSIRCWSASSCGRSAHLIANGDLGSIILFGSFLAWAVYDRITLKRRSDPGAPPIPVGGRDCDIIAVVVGTLLYLALGFWFHPYVIGVPAFAFTR